MLISVTDKIHREFFNKYINLFKEIFKSLKKSKINNLKAES